MYDVTDVYSVSILCIFNFDRTVIKSRNFVSPPSIVINLPHSALVARHNLHVHGHGGHANMFIIKSYNYLFYYYSWAGSALRERREYTAFP